MSAHDDYVGRVYGLVISLGRILTPDEVGDVLHLIDHGEPVEGLRELAWIIVDGDKRIPVDAYHDILELASGLVSDSHMPENLADCVIAADP